MGKDDKDPHDEAKAREAKLAHALRANLRRRKAAPAKPTQPPAPETHD